MGRIQPILSKCGQRPGEAFSAESLGLLQNYGFFSKVLFKQARKVLLVPAWGNNLLGCCFYIICL